MKKIMISLIVMLAILLSLEGCFIPRPWHGGGGRHDRGGKHDRGRGHDKGGHSFNLDGGQYYYMDDDQYKRREFR